MKKKFLFLLPIFALALAGCDDPVEEEPTDSGGDNTSVVEEPSANEPTGDEPTGDEPWNDDLVEGELSFVDALKTDDSTIVTVRGTVAGVSGSSFSLYRNGNWIYVYNFYSSSSEEDVATYGVTTGTYVEITAMKSSYSGGAQLTAYSNRSYISERAYTLISETGETVVPLEYTTTEDVSFDTDEGTSHNGAMVTIKLRSSGDQAVDGTNSSTQTLSFYDTADVALDVLLEEYQFADVRAALAESLPSFEDNYYYEVTAMVCARSSATALFRLYLVDTSTAVKTSDEPYVAPEGSEPEVLPDPTTITISALNALTSDDQYKTLYQVSGVFEQGTANYATTSGYGFLHDIDNPSDSIYVYGITTSESSITYSSSEQTYSFSNSRDFADTGIKDGSYVTLNVIFLIYNGTYEIQGYVVSTTDPDAYTVDYSLSYENTYGSVALTNNTHTDEDGKVHFGDSLTLAYTQATGYENYFIDTVELNGNAVSLSENTFTNSGYGKLTISVTFADQPAAEPFWTMDATDSNFSSNWTGTFNNNYSYVADFQYTNNSTTLSFMGAGINNQSSSNNYIRFGGTINQTNLVSDDYAEYAVSVLDLHTPISATSFAFTIRDNSGALSHFTYLTVQVLSSEPDEITSYASNGISAVSDTDVVETITVNSTDEILERNKTSTFEATETWENVYFRFIVVSNASANNGLDFTALSFYND